MVVQPPVYLLQLYPLGGFAFPGSSLPALGYYRPPRRACLSNSPRRKKVRASSFPRKLFDCQSCCRFLETSWRRSGNGHRTSNPALLSRRVGDLLRDAVGSPHPSGPSHFYRFSRPNPFGGVCSRMATVRQPIVAVKRVSLYIVYQAINGRDARLAGRFSTPGSRAGGKPLARRE